jgi:integrase
LVIFIRWTKSLQRYNQTLHLTLFPIPGSPLCPVQAFLLLQRLFPVPSASPFLSYYSSGRLITLSQGDLRRSLRALLVRLRLNPHLSFHSFRRSAASLAYSSGLSFSAIQSHGTWSSDALLAYLDSGARDPSVSLFFSSFFSSS